MQVHKSLPTNVNKAFNPTSEQPSSIHVFQQNDDQALDENVVCYHYTSANAMLSILNALDKGYGSIRFTDSHYMNDRSEHMFFIKRLLEFLDKNSEKYPFCQQVINEFLLKKYSIEDFLSLHVSDFGDLFENVETTKLKQDKESSVFDNLFSRVKSRHFLFCLCRDDDSLHMWNYYLHNGNYQGYNIGIKPLDLLQNLRLPDTEEFDPFLFYYGDVLYTKEQQEKQIKALCNTIESVPKNPNRSNDPLQIGMMILWTYIQCFGLFFKDESFMDEKEFRIVIECHEINQKHDLFTYLRSDKRNIRYTFFERNGILVPCLEIPLAKEAVKQITMAPILESKIAASSVRDFLDWNNYSDVVIKQSAIPIRY